MCGRYSQTRELNELEQFFGFSAPDTGLAPRFNVAPMQYAPVVILNDQGERELRMMRWGLLPGWAREEKLANKLINARGETIAEKPSFRSAYRHRRCLVLADGFYEWKQQGTAKQPYRIVLDGDQPFAMAGLWERWAAPEGEELTTFTIVTTTPNAFMESIHTRMPVILRRDDEEAWLSPATPRGALEKLIGPFPGGMKAYPVDRMVNNPRNETPQLILPIEAEGMDGTGLAPRN